MLKSAIRAAKKKNDLSDDIIYLVGNEDEAIVPVKAASPRGASKRPEVIEEPKHNVDKTPSLKETLSKISNIGNQDTKSEGEGETVIKRNTNLPKNEFTQADVDERWTLFVERLKKKDVRMYAAFKPIQPILKENYKIEVNFQNNSQLEEFKNRYRPKVTSEMREELKNEYLEFVESVLEAEKMERPNFLSENEKLKKMMEKNPALEQLKKKFKLDFE